MSHYTEIKLAFKDRASLVEALIASGVPQEWIEVHDEPQLIKDWCGKTSQYRYADTQDERFKAGDKAHIIIRRSHLGSSNNDFGVYIDPEGESICFLCDFSRKNTTFNDAWLGKVSDKYAIKQIEQEHAEKSEQTYTVEHEGKTYIYVKAG